MKEWGLRRARRNGGRDLGWRCQMLRRSDCVGEQAWKAELGLQKRWTWLALEDESSWVP